MWNDRPDSRPRRLHSGLGRIVAQSYTGKEPVIGKNIRCVSLDVHAATIHVAIAEGREPPRSLGVIENRPEAVRRSRLRGRRSFDFIAAIGGCRSVVNHPLWSSPHSLENSSASYGPSAYTSSAPGPGKRPQPEHTQRQLRGRACTTSACGPRRPHAPSTNSRADLTDHQDDPRAASSVATSCLPASLARLCRFTILRGTAARMLEGSACQMPHPREAVG
jgi:hypothetical protein